MGAQKIQAVIDAYDYWEALVVKLECNYIGDEVTIEYIDDEALGSRIRYHCTGCYEILFRHALAYTKERPIKQMMQEQLSFYLQDVKVEEEQTNGAVFYRFMVNMFPVDFEVLCQNIVVEKIDVALALEPN